MVWASVLTIWSENCEDQIQCTLLCKHENQMMNHKNLDLWKKSIKLAGDVFRLTRTLPIDHRFGISDQMQRASVSIGSNVAEGAARGSNRDFIRFLNIAAGSASELDTHLAILREIDPSLTEKLESIQQSLIDISKMIQGLVKSLRRKLS